MFNKKEEKKTIVSQLNEEVERLTFSPIDRTGWFSPFLVDEEVDENRKMFAELLSRYITDEIKEHYIECSDCGCLIVKGKVEFVKRGDERIDYCKNCKPAYDEILVKYDGMEDEYKEVGYLKNGVMCDQSGKLSNTKNEK